MCSICSFCTSPILRVEKSARSPARTRAECNRQSTRVNNLLYVKRYSINLPARKNCAIQISLYDSRENADSEIILEARHTYVMTLTCIARLTMSMELWRLEAVVRAWNTFKTCEQLQIGFTECRTTRQSHTQSLIVYNCNLQSEACSTSYCCCSLELPIDCCLTKIVNSILVRNKLLEAHKSCESQQRCKYRRIVVLWRLCLTFAVYLAICWVKTGVKFTISRSATQRIPHLCWGPLQ